jgi:hypothetical protein
MWSYILRFALGVCLVGSAFAQEWEVGTSDAPLEGRTYNRYVLSGKWLTPPSSQDATSSLPEMRVFCYEAKINQIDIYFGTALKHRNTNIPFVPIQKFIVRIDSKKPLTLDVGPHLSGDGTTYVMRYSQRLEEDILEAKRVVIGATEKGSERDVVMEFEMPDPAPLLDRCSRSLKRLK